MDRFSYALALPVEDRLTDRSDEAAFPIRELLYLAGDVLHSVPNHLATTATAIAGLAFELHVQRLLCENAGYPRITADAGGAITSLLYDGAISRSTFDVAMELRREIRVMDLTNVDNCRTLFERIFAFLKGGAL